MPVNKAYPLRTEMPPNKLTPKLDAETTRILFLRQSSSQVNRISQSLKIRLLDFSHSVQLAADFKYSNVGWEERGIEKAIKISN